MKRAKRTCSLLLALLLCLALLPLSAAAAASFSDTTGHWARAHIDRWSSYGVISGVGNGLFNPDGLMTRGEAAAAFSNLLKLTEEADLSAFRDASGRWDSPYIARCVAQGYLKGKEGGLMDPDGYMLREDFLTLFARAMGLGEDASTLIRFSDANQIDDYAAGALNRLANLGFISGDGGALRPRDMITRAEVMALLDKSIAQYVTKDYAFVQLLPGGLTVIAAKDVHVSGEGMVAVSPAGNVYTPGGGTSSGGSGGNAGGGDIISVPSTDSYQQRLNQAIAAVIGVDSDGADQLKNGVYSAAAATNDLNIGFYAYAAGPGTITVSTGAGSAVRTIGDMEDALLVELQRGEQAATIKASYAEDYTALIKAARVISLFGCTVDRADAMTLDALKSSFTQAFVAQFLVQHTGSSDAWELLESSAALYLSDSLSDEFKAALVNRLLGTDETTALSYAQTAVFARNTDALRAYRQSGSISSLQPLLQDLDGQGLSLSAAQLSLLYHFYQNPPAYTADELHSLVRGLPYSALAGENGSWFDITASSDIGEQARYTIMFR